MATPPPHKTSEDSQARASSNRTRVLPDPAGALITETRLPSGSAGSPVPGSVCRYYLPRPDDRSHVLIGQWTTATLRMTCLTGGLTPCSAATGIPGRPATSSSPTCRAYAALTKAFPGTPWSGARPTAAAQPGTARDTTRPTQGDREPTEAFDTSAVTRHSATVADACRQTGSRSHRGSELSSAPPPPAKPPSTWARCGISLTYRCE